MLKNDISLEYQKFAHQFRDILWDYKKSGGKFINLAQEAGVSHTVVTKFLKGDDLKLSTAWKLLRVLLNRPPVDLTDDDDLTELRQLAHRLKSILS